MMLSRTESGDGERDGNPNNAQLSHDIKVISKALYLHQAPRKALVSTSGAGARSKSVERPRLTESKSHIDQDILDGSVWSEDKKLSSGWSWKKPLKALSHIRRQKFNISCVLHVHSIKELPPKFNDIDLSVHWKRKNEDVKTRPSGVVNGNVEFDETLMHKCHVYGSRTGPLHSAKYEAKLFLIYASVVGAPGIDMGKHWVDLTRLLPLTLEELEGEKATGKWTTSFKLSGKAKGATLNVSFGFSLVRNSSIESRSNLNISKFVDLAQNSSHALEQRTDLESHNSSGVLQRVGSIPTNWIDHFPHFSQHVDVKICDEVPRNPGIELSESINFLYEKLNEVHLHNSVDLDMPSQEVWPHKQKVDLDSEADQEGSEKYDHADFTVIEQRIEVLDKKEIELEKVTVYRTNSSPIEIIDVDEIIRDDDATLDVETNFHSEDIICDSYKDRIKVDDCKHEETSVCEKELLVEDLVKSLSISEHVKCESQLATGEFLGLENYVKTKTSYKACKAAKRSMSLDQSAESVASDFLNMLGIVHSPFVSSESDAESPRERLLREFEKEALTSGNFIMNSDADREHEVFGCIDLAETACCNLSEGFDLSSAILAAEEEHHRTSELLSRRRKAKVLEDLETEDLMRKWGLNEQIFQHSPHHCSDGFGSPIELLPEEVLELPPLGDGYGSFVPVKDGGCLRSMNPSLFGNSKNVGSLIMQVSRPVVLSAQMGCDIMGILQHMASLGSENLRMQTSKLMPLEDLTGKTLQQIAQDARPGATGPNRRAPLFHQSLSGQRAFSRRKEARRFGSNWFFSDNDSSLNINEVTSDYATVEDLTHLEVDKIESMSIEGLKIQSGMSEGETMSSIRAQSSQKISANLGGFHNFEGGGKLQPLEATGGGNEFDGLLGLSIPLEEWLRLDVGDIGDDDQSSEHPRMIFAGHKDKCVDFVNRTLREDIDQEKAYGREHGLLGNNLMLALRILLRDPLRNYEPVGDSMLALIQVERATVHPTLELHRSVSETSSGEEEDQEWMHKEDLGDSRKEAKNKRCSLWFKIAGVHLSGLNTRSGKSQLQGTKTHQQSGFRWLLASGMSKSYKPPKSESKTIIVSKPQFMTNAQNCDLLWSISSHVNGTEANWTHKRNPNVIFPE
uniref:Uncharacterized protein LOC105122155 n=1 Tax=Rhizophora mucronata TaxID=61149 RepID=A0A2P2Q429_RHIMU